MDSEILNGYKVVEGNGDYKHYFGGSRIESQPCPTCGGLAHVLITFDLKDPAFNRIKTTLNKLPLVSCLNCSGNTDTQIYKIEEGRILNLQQKVEEKWVLDPEDQLPSPLPEVALKLELLKNSEIMRSGMTDDQIDYIFDSFGTDYICRAFGGILNDGDPSTITCPCCEKEMTYLASLTEDSTEGELITSIEFLLGEVILHYFFCEGCDVLRVELLQ